MTEGPAVASADAVSPTRFAASYRVRFDESVPTGTIRTSGLLRYAQDVAWMHSDALGFDRDWYQARSLTWLVRAAAAALESGDGGSRSSPRAARLAAAV